MTTEATRMQNPIDCFYRYAAKIFLIFFLTAPSWYSLRAQNHKADSLIAVLEAGVADPQEKCKLLLRIARAYEYDTYALSLRYANEALELAEQHRLQKMVTSSLIQLGITHMYMGGYEQAFKHFEKADSIWKASAMETDRQTSLNNLALLYMNNGDLKKGRALFSESMAIAMKQKKKNWEAIADLYSNIAMLKIDENEYDSSLFFFMKALAIADTLHYSALAVRTVGEIGGIYSRLNEYEKAKEYYNRFLILAQQQKNKYYECMAYNHLGSIEQNVDNEEMKRNYLKAFAIASELKNGDLLATCYGHLARVEEAYHNFSAALQYRRKSVALGRNFGFPANLGISLCRLGHNYVLVGKPDSALQALDEARVYLKKVAHAEVKLAYLETRMEAFSRLGQYDSTQYYFDQFKTSMDTLKQKERRDQVSNWQVKYETEKKEKEIAILTQQATTHQMELSKQNMMVYSALALVLVVAAFSYLYVRQVRLRTAQKESAVEQKMLRTQMNPHFIFNALISIESFIYENEPREAGKYLSRFAKLMRLSLENSRREYISLQQEILTLEHYFALQKLRLGDKVDYEIFVAEGIDVENTLIPPMFAQPLIENSLEHGIINKKGKGIIRVSFSLESDVLLLVVEDNGIGRSKALELEEREHTSLASTITSERIDVMNRRKKGKVSLKLMDLVDADNNVLGTKAFFYFPMKLVYPL
jgi:tetratricopeptide (TPR) repeat protein